VPAGVLVGWSAGAPALGSLACSTGAMREVRRPDWWPYPESCQHGHPWGPGRVIVSWMPCDCGPARAERQRGPGHLTVSCQVPGCRSRWYRPDHDPGAAG